MTDFVLQVSNLTKRYGNLVAVNGMHQSYKKLSDSLRILALLYFFFNEF